ncbi:hypothetical protein NN3_18440 [Nocardia neocaledoniensis NBRC 108232]|nr:hypothetical protein NN3_18440 [Nocardia neocaledoniensis NBRC 108232]
MRAPITESVKAGAQVLASRLRHLATAASMRYRATSSVVRPAADDLAEREARAMMLVKGFALGLTSGVGIYSGMQLVMDDPGQEPEESTGLGAEVDRLVAMSPTLSKKVQQLLADGWTISYGPIGAQGITSREEKEIVINPAGENDPLLITAVLAHESGHATASPEYSFLATEPQPGEDYRQWFEKNLYRAFQDESNAGLTTAQVRREILDNSGPDIGNIDGATKATYGRYVADDLTRPAAIDLLADRLRDHSRAYRDDYGKYLEQEWQRFTGTPPSPTPSK